MIIVSQDKTDIINFDNAFRLCVCMCSSEEFTTEPHYWCIKAEKAEDNLIHIFLGEYKTEERAKKILKDIVLKYEAIELCKNKSADNLGYTLADYTPVYEMPEV